MMLGHGAPPATLPASATGETLAATSARPHPLPPLAAAGERGRAKPARRWRRRGPSSLPHGTRAARGSPPWQGRGSRGGHRRRRRAGPAAAAQDGGCLVLRWWRLDGGGRQRARRSRTRKAAFSSPWCVGQGAARSAHSGVATVVATALCCNTTAGTLRARSRPGRAIVGLV